MTRGREPEATGLSYDELPDRFGPVLLRPIKEHNPLEFKDLTRRQPKVLPVPEDVDEKKAQKLRNLAQYKGRSPEGNRRSVANLRRREKVADDKAVVLAEDAPVPSVPTPKQMPARPPEKGPTARHLRLVLSKQEYDLYVDTWNGIWQAHKDEYNLPEDLHDVHTICMETVLQMRMLSYAQSRPRQYSEKAYHNSTVRLQKARENLLARRKDRVEPAAKKGNKGNTTNNTINVAVLAGEVDHNKIDAQLAEEEQELNSFLEDGGTRDVKKALDVTTDQVQRMAGRTTREVVDGEATEVEEEGGEA